MNAEAGTGKARAGAGAGEPGRGPLGRIVHFAVAAVFLAALAVFVVRHPDEISAAFKEIRWRWLVPVIAAVMANNLLKAVLWARLLRSMGGALSTGELLAVWHYSLAGLYVPGSIWMVVGRVVMLRRRQVPVKPAVSSVLMEQMAPVATGLCVALLSPVVRDRIFLPAWAAAALAMPVATVVLFPWLPGECLRQLGFRRVNLRIENRPALGITAGFMLGHLFTWALAGMGLAMMMELFGASADRVGPLNASAIAAAAFVTGYLSVLTPSGIGVREAMLIFFLSRYFPMPVAVLVSVLARLWETMANGLGILAGMAALSRHPAWLGKTGDGVEAEQAGWGPNGEPQSRPERGTQAPG